MNVYIFSENLIVRERFKKALSFDFDVSIFNEFKTLKDQLLIKESELVLLDSNSSILENLVHVKSMNNNVKVLVTSSKPTFNEGITLLQHGAKAYANSYISEVNIPNIFATVSTGHIWLYPEFMQKMIVQSQPEFKSKTNKCKELLNEKEYETASLVADGLGNKEIAQKLQLSQSTVKNRITSLFLKLDVTDRLSMSLLFNA